MPLRDHFQPPTSLRATWDGLHGMWPGDIVRQLRTLLPHGYVASPLVHLGSQIEADLGAFENDNAPRITTSNDQGTAPTALWAPPEPTLAVETEIPDEDEFAVRIYDAERGRQLVATIELVSPGNKDRPDKRNAFVGKCAALLRRGVAVSIVDVVTPRRSNLYVELLRFVGYDDPTMPNPAPHLYAVSCRWAPHAQRMLFRTWSHPLVLEQPLPTLPLWLTDTLAVPLDLEQSYEQACHNLWLT